MDLYHGTFVKGISVLTPQLDGWENTPYVFATPNFVSALRYITPTKGNLCFGIIDGTAVIVERFRGAFDKSYNNLSGVVYVVSPDTFSLTNLKTRIEYVSKYPVKCNSAIEIPDVAQRLLKAESRGLLKIYRYPDLPDGYSLFNETLTSKLKRFAYRVAQTCGR